MASGTDYADRVGYRLKQAEHALRLAMDVALDGLHLTTPQYAALSALARDPGSANVDLARACFVTAQTMHRIVRQLLDKGLVATGGGGRGRAHRLELTTEGVRVLGAAHDAVEAIERRMTAGEDTADVVGALSRYVRRLDGPPG